MLQIYTLMRSNQLFIIHNLVPNPGRILGG